MRVSYFVVWSACHSSQPDRKGSLLWTRPKDWMQLWVTFFCIIELYLRHKSLPWLVLLKRELHFSSLFTLSSFMVGAENLFNLSNSLFISAITWVASWKLAVSGVFTENNQEFFFSYVTFLACMTFKNETNPRKMLQYLSSCVYNYGFILKFTKKSAIPTISG